MENDTIEEDNALSHLAKTVTDRVPNKFDYHVQFEAQWIIRFQDMTFLVVNQGWKMMVMMIIMIMMKISQSARWKILLI